MSAPGLFKIQPWRLGYRVPLLVVHVLLLPLALLAYLPGVRRLPSHGQTLRARVHHWWVHRLLGICGVELVSTGQLPTGPSLLVANHVSWLDILLLHSFRPVWLVAKAEIARWPMVGPVARLAGTVFIERGEARSRQRVQRTMTALLKCGDTVGVFPEAGIPGAAKVGRFHSRLLGSAIRARAPVVPVGIRYRDPRTNANAHEIAVFGPGTGFVGNALRIMSYPQLRAEVMIADPLTHLETGREALARQARQIIENFYAA
jgi:1-acyl-sn-glycerol-3-phosphate acyltransferase